MYDHYNVAKRALSKANDVCQIANDVARATGAKLSDANELVSQVSSLHELLGQQLRALRQIARRLQDEEQRIKSDFDVILRELDSLDGDLNRALIDLRHTTLPRELSLQHEDQTDEEARARLKTLYEFADETAVEFLKGQLREAIDDVQEIHESLTSLVSGFKERSGVLEKHYSALPSTPNLPPANSITRPEAGQKDSNDDSPRSIAPVTTTYIQQHEEHLHQMADLLVSLSQHYDHSCTLLKSETTLPPDEVEELQTIVGHDAHQLEDVLTELDERLVDLEEDANVVTGFVSSCLLTKESLLAAFREFEALDLDHVASQLEDIRSHSELANDRLDVLRQQLVGLADHYTAFAVSYDALLLEVDRRTKYDTTIATLLAQTNETLAHLAHEEESKRDQFVQDHGDSLPGDIWHGITERPITYDIRLSETKKAPRLPEAMIEAARQRLSSTSL